MGSGPRQTGISGLLVVVAAPANWTKSLVLPMGKLNWAPDPPVSTLPAQ